MKTLTQRLKDFAHTLGFSMLGVTPAEPSPRLAAYLDWIATGMHGEMAYMAREDRVARRRDLNVILPGARTLIVAALDYYTLKLPDEIAQDPQRGRFSNYAWAVDYHDVMLPQLDRLVAFLREEAGASVAARSYVDTGAVLERSHAERAGLGFIGKNSLLINPRKGSFLFLGEIITDVALDYDELQGSVSMPGCGSCTRCLNACPTSAFPRPYVLDARRCISYLTIEHRGFIPAEFRPLLGNWIYGCDVCQEVCPWQRFAEPRWESVFGPINLDRAAPRLQHLLTLDDEQFIEIYKGSPIYRIKRDRLVRNACVAAGNSGVTAIAEYLVPLLEDCSSYVRGHAAWALGQLAGGRDALRAAHRAESDATVRDEISAALRAGWP